MLAAWVAARYGYGHGSDSSSAAEDKCALATSELLASCAAEENGSLTLDAFEGAAFSAPNGALRTAGGGHPAEETQGTARAEAAPASGESALAAAARAVAAAGHTLLPGAVASALAFGAYGLAAGAAFWLATDYPYFLVFEK
jgi:hypothetical protein